MELLEGDKMPLKFRCKVCNSDIIIRFLKIGEIAKCKFCDTNNMVPETANIITEDEACKLNESKKPLINPQDSAEVVSWNTRRTLIGILIIVLILFSYFIIIMLVFHVGIVEAISFLLILLFVSGIELLFQKLFPEKKDIPEQPTRETHGYSVEIWELNKNDILDALESKNVVEKAWALNELKKFSLQVIEAKESLEKWRCIYGNKSK
jgi:hypothetical protein